MTTKIVKRVSDNVVLFAGDNLSISGDGVVSGGDWSYKRPAGVDLVLELVEGLPDLYIAGGFTYTGGTWEPNSTGDAYILPDKRAAKIAELEAARLEVEYSDITHAGQTWKADKDSRALLAQVLAPGSVKAGAYWRDAAGTKHTVTYADLQALGRAISDRGYTADENLETKKAAVVAAATEAEIDQITWE